jgi:predicted enzyme related to lactoylglutathione lyase
MTDKLNPVGWFEIPVLDMDRAKEFYDAVFGFDLELHDMGPMRMAWFPMSEDVWGAPGALVLMDGYTPSDDGIRIYFTAPDIEETVVRASANGGHILQPRTSIGEYGFIARFKDTEGNHIAIHSRY